FAVFCLAFTNVMAQAPCEQKILFWSPSSNNSVPSIWIMDTTGNNRKRIFNDIYHRTALTVSHSGDKMAYAKRKNPYSLSSGDSLWICTSNIDGSNEQHHYLLPNYATHEIRDIDFNSTDTKILFNTFEGINRDGDLYILTISTGSVLRLTYNSDTCKGEVRFSPDDSTILYTQNGTQWYAFPFPGRRMKSNGTNISVFN